MNTVCWYFDVTALSDPELFSRAMSLLPWEERREKVMRFRFEKDRRLCLGAGLLLAYALRRAGVKDPAVRVLPKGKPVLAQAPDIHFNLSHSGTLAVCALSGRPVGADVEVLRDADPRIAERWFRTEEREWIRGSGEPGRAFTRLWTRKESYLKLLGTGLSLPLRSFSVLPGEAGPEGCVFYERELMEHMISVCTEEEGEVVFREGKLSRMME